MCIRSEDPGQKSAHSEGTAAMAWLQDANGAGCISATSWMRYHYRLECENRPRAASVRYRTRAPRSLPSNLKLPTLGLYFEAY